MHISHNFNKNAAKPTISKLVFLFAVSKMTLQILNTFKLINTTMTLKIGTIPRMKMPYSEQLCQTWNPKKRSTIQDLGQGQDLKVWGQELSPSSEFCFINDVSTPPFSYRTPWKSDPTPQDKRILEQKEFDKKSKAKRAFFEKDRRKSPKSPKLKYYEKELVTQSPPRGELDFLNMEQLINVKDIVNVSASQRLGWHQRIKEERNKEYNFKNYNVLMKDTLWWF